jgi:hypothetical protein
MSKKINKNHTGWAKVLVNNTFILYTHAIDASESSEKSIDDEGKGFVIMEVPHTISDRTFSKLHSDYLISKNNFVVNTVDGVEKKIPIVPSYLFAHRRAYRKFSVMIAQWWHSRRDTFPASNRTKDRRAFNAFCKRAPGFANMKDNRRWFNQTMIQYENDLKEGRDPMAPYADAPDFSDISKKASYVAPAAARVSDVARAQVEDYHRKSKADEAKSDSESSDSDSDSDSESEEEEEEKEEKPKALAVAKPVRRDFDAESDSDSDSDSDSEGEEEEEAPKAKKPVAKAKAVRKRAESSDEESDSDSESEAEVKPKKSRK